MWSQLPLGCVLASIFLCSGCIAAAWIRMRRIEQDADRLDQGFAMKTQEHDDAYLRLESRVEDLAGRLARSTAERRELSGAHQRVSSDNQALATALQDARQRAQTMENELAHVPEAIVALAAGLGEGEPLGSAFREETVAAQEEGLAMPEWLENEVSPSSTDAPRSLAHPSRDPETESGALARVSGLERRFATWDEQLSRHVATIGSLREAAAVQGGQLEAVTRRCSELERQVQQMQVQQMAARRPEPAQTVPAAESSKSGSEVGFETRLAMSDDNVRRSAAEIEALQTEKVANLGQLEAAARRCSELEQQVQQHIQREQGRLAREQEQHQASTAQASEFEGLLASRDEELRQRVGMIERLQDGVVAKARELESADQRRADLEQKLRVMAQEEQGRLARQEDELRQRALRIELLEGDVVAKTRLFEAAVQRCGELEQQLRRQEERDQERGQRESELQRALSARAGDLEGRLASLDEELRRRSATIDQVQAEMAAKDQRLVGLGESCVQLERELERRAEQDQEREAQKRDAASESLRRTSELEGELASRREEIQRLRDELSQLSDRYQGLSDRLEQRLRDLRGREEHLGVVQARLEAVDAVAESGREDIRANEAMIDEFVENRISNLFKRRTTPSAETLPELYLDGLEQGDFDLALQGLLGDPEPLATPSVARLGARWQRELRAWETSALDREVVYLWADGVHLRAGLETEGTAALVVVGSHADGSRSVLAVESGDPASKEAWLGVLRNLVQRGMNVPRLVVAAGTSGLWSGLDELGWDCARQTCWSHKTAQVQAALPKKRQSQAGEILRAASNANSRVAAKKLRDRFVRRCGVRCAGAAELLSSEWKQMTSFYAFPEDHWPQLRTTGVIESPLTAIRLRANEPKASKPSAHVDAVLWKLLGASVKTVKKLSAPQLLPTVAGRRRRTEGGSGDRPRLRIA